MMISSPLRSWSDRTPTRMAWSINAEPLARLCDAAVAYSTANWPILPTRAPDYSQLVCTQAPASPEIAFEWWSQQQYGIACPVGRLFDLVQVPAIIGRRMLLKLADRELPVLQFRIGRGVPVWGFLVQPGAPRIHDLPAACPVTVIGRERWVSLPPTPSADRSVRWVTAASNGRFGVRLSEAASPEIVSLLRLPHSLHVQWAALHALTAASRRAEARDEAAMGAALRQEYETGATVASLARRLVRSPKYIQRILRDAGTEFRPAGTPRPAANRNTDGDLIVWSQSS